MALHLEPAAVNYLVGCECRQRARGISPGHAYRLEQLEVRLTARDVRVDVDEHLVRPRGGEGDRVVEPPTGAYRRVAMDDVRKVGAADGQVDPRKRVYPGRVRRP